MKKTKLSELDKEFTFKKTDIDSIIMKSISENVIKLILNKIKDKEKD